MATLNRPVGGFCSGTKLMTLRGEVPVESVRAGDTALTLSGVEAPLKPVTRVRHRRVDLNRHAAAMLAAPVRVRAGAIEDGVPLRDLRVSPDHALSVEDDTGRRVLIPALYLANGATILREPASGAVTYVTVSLERHDILMGDGMAAESGPGTCSTRNRRARSCRCGRAAPRRPRQPSRGRRPITRRSRAKTRAHRCCLAMPPPPCMRGCSPERWTSAMPRPKSRA